ncbi:MAG: caspase family protein [Gammaproteobacteria bacterium]|jgi:hypothetical protein
MPSKKKQKKNQDDSIKTIEDGNVKAVLVGINYRGTRNELGGCINDVINTRKQVLTEYPTAKIELMTDDTPTKPTRDNILGKLNDLVNNAQPGDTLIFHYSGHGSQVPDLEGDEEDGYDETICPIDFINRRTIIVNGIRRTVDSEITDDEIHGIISNIPKNVNFLMLSDSCHSGTIGDLKYDFAHYHGPSEWRGVNNAIAEQVTAPIDPENRALTVEGGLNLHFNPGATTVNELFSLDASVKYSYDPDTGKHNHYSGGKKRSLNMRAPNCEGGELRIISGCEENQTSADTGTNGACTRAFWDTVRSMGGLHKFFPKLFSHHIDDLKSIQDTINRNLSRFGFTQHSVISWDHATSSRNTSFTEVVPVEAEPTVSTSSTHPMSLRKRPRI